MESKTTVEIRPITKADTSAILRWRNSERVVKNFIYQAPLTEQEHLTWIKSQVETGKCHQFIMQESATGFAFGTIYLRDVDYQHKKAEYGIYICEDSALGKGYAIEASRQILHYAFHTLHLNKVFLRVLAGNEKAMRTYRACGFVPEGRFRQDVFVNGHFEDVIFMSVLECEWT